MSFWSWLPDWVKTVRVRARYLFGVWCLGLLVLALPQWGAEFFGVTDFREVARPYVGVITLAAFVFWIIALVPWFQTRRRTREYLETTLANFKTLSEDERLVMAYCVYREQRTVLLPAIEPVALSLCSKGLLDQMEGHGNIAAWPFTVPEHVWDALELQPGLVARSDDRRNPAVVERFREIDRRAQHGIFLDL